MSSDARYQALLARCADLLESEDRDATVTLIAVPGSTVETSRSRWLSSARKLPPTAVDTRDLLNEAVAETLRRSSGPVIVLSDQPVQSALGDRMIQIAPAEPRRNTGIDTLAARQGERRQVMVRLVNDSAAKSVRLRVRSGAVTMERDVSLTKKSVDTFFDLPSLDQIVSAEIESDDDDVPADNAAWLVRQPRGARIDVAGDVSNDVRRFAAIYAAQRPGFTRIMVTGATLPAGQVGLQLVPTKSGRAVISSPLTTVANAITQNVIAWPDAAAAVSEPPGYQVLVRRDGKPLVAVTRNGPRQVWVNLNETDWTGTIDFVVFFSNVFDWLRGGGVEEFTSISPTLLDPEWKRLPGKPRPAGVAAGLWPGVYQSDGGKPLAVNARPLALPSVVDPGGAGRPRNATRVARQTVSLSGILCLFALSVAAVSALLGPASRVRNAASAREIARRLSDRGRS